jgi:cellulose synthase (UDP-forming)
MAAVVKGGQGRPPASVPKHRKSSHSHNPSLPDAAVPSPRDTPAPSPAIAPRARDLPVPDLVPEIRASPETAPGPLLPVPPADSEKYSYVRRFAWVLTLCSAVSFPSLVYSQVEMVRRYEWFWIYVPFMLLGIAIFMIPLFTDGLSRGFDLAEHRRLADSWKPSWYPSVDIFLPVCGEPIEVLRNTWKHVTALSETYQGTVFVYVLDDSASPEIKKMACDLGFSYVIRPERGWLKKSGNLLYGYRISEGEFILLLDADFAPRKDLLDETIPYMEEFPKIGIVQTPQFFRVSDQQTWVERGAGAVQELFYRSIQMARAKKGGATCVGSCAVYRRAALDDNRGMSLSEHSEDLRTGFDLHRLGWRLHYLPIALSTGNCPDNVLAFLNQQYRWCSGTIGLMVDKIFWHTKMSLYTRMCYISGFVYYLYTAAFVFVVPTLSICILLFVPNVLVLKNIIFIAPILFYAGVIYPMWHHSPYRLEAWSVKVISGWAHVFTIWDVARGTRLGWQPSGSGATKQDGARRFWIGVIGWSGGTAVVWAGLGFWRLMTMNPYNIFLIFILGVFQVVVVSRVLIQPRAGAAT